MEENLNYSAQDKIKVIKQEPSDRSVYSWMSELISPNYMTEIKSEQECTKICNSDLISDDQGKQTSLPPYLEEKFAFCEKWRKWDLVLPAEKTHLKKINQIKVIKQEPTDTSVYSWTSELISPNYMQEIKSEQECTKICDSDLISDDQNNSDNYRVNEDSQTDFKQESNTKGEFSKIFVSDFQITVDQTPQLKNEIGLENKEKIMAACTGKPLCSGCCLCDIPIDLCTESSKLCSSHSVPDSPYKSKSYKCAMCDKSFSYKHHLKRHILSVHEHFRPYKCPECDFASSQKKDLIIHTNSVHERLKPFNCPKCALVFSQKPHLTGHIKNVHEKLKPFKCLKCHYSCSTKSRLSIHIESVHDKFRPFKCSNCDYASNRKKDLCSHIKTVHEKLRPFICGVCDNKLSTKASLTAHLIAIHETDPEKFRPFKCLNCNYASNRKKDLCSHIMRVHEKRKSI